MYKEIQAGWARPGLAGQGLVLSKPSPYIIEPEKICLRPALSFFKVKRPTRIELFQPGQAGYPRSRPDLQATGSAR